MIDRGGAPDSGVSVIEHPDPRLPAATSTSTRCAGRSIGSAPGTRRSTRRTCRRCCARSVRHRGGGAARAHRSVRCDARRDRTTTTPCGSAAAGWRCGRWACPTRTGQWSPTRMRLPHPQRCGGYLAPDAFWVNDIEARERALLKIAAARCCRATCGLAIPETLYQQRSRRDPPLLGRASRRGRHLQAAYADALARAVERRAPCALHHASCATRTCSDDEALVGLPSDLPAQGREGLRAARHLHGRALRGRPSRLAVARYRRGIDWRRDMVAPLQAGAVELPRDGRGALHRAHAQARTCVRLHRPHRHARGRTRLPRGQRDGPVLCGRGARAGDAHCCGPSRRCSIEARARHGRTRLVGDGLRSATRRFPRVAATGTRTRAADDRRAACGLRRCPVSALEPRARHVPRAKRSSIRQPAARHGAAGASRSSHAVLAGLFGAVAVALVLVLPLAGQRHAQGRRCRGVAAAGAWAHPRRSGRRPGVVRRAQGRGRPERSRPATCCSCVGSERGERSVKARSSRRSHALLRDRVATAGRRAAGRLLRRRRSAAAAAQMQADGLGAELRPHRRSSASLQRQRVELARGQRSRLRPSCRRRATSRPQQVQDRQAELHRPAAAACRPRPRARAFAAARELERRAPRVRDAAAASRSAICRPASATSRRSSRIWPRTTPGAACVVRAPQDGTVTAITRRARAIGGGAEAGAGIVLPAGSALEAELYAPSRAVRLRQAGHGRCCCATRPMRTRSSAQARGRVREVSATAMRADELQASRSTGAGTPGADVPRARRARSADDARLRRSTRRARRAARRSTRPSCSSAVVCSNGSSSRCTRWAGARSEHRRRRSKLRFLARPRAAACCCRPRPPSAASPAWRWSPATGAIASTSPACGAASPCRSKGSALKGPACSVAQALGLESAAAEGSTMEQLADAAAAVHPALGPESLRRARIAERRHAVVHDPCFGRRELLARELSLHFTGVALELLPGNGFVAVEARRATR